MNKIKATAKFLWSAISSKSSGAILLAIAAIGEPDRVAKAVLMCSAMIVFWIPDGKTEITIVVNKKGDDE